ncbi:MAG TPA: hypothetical protein ENN03_07500 [bacterium]|nr:hypothetical protein [bacterium]
MIRLPVRYYSDFSLAFLLKIAYFFFYSIPGGIMVLSNIRIKAFKSVQSLTLPLDPKITVLIGPNESGKTNILKAIESINSDQPLNLEQTCQFSGSYAEGKPPQIGLELDQINRKEQAVLGKIHEALRNAESFTLWRMGPDAKDYRIQLNDKFIAIENMKPILKNLPQILYFDKINVVKDQIDIDSLTKANSDVLTELNLLKIGGIQEPGLIFEDSTRGRRAAEEASREITRRIQEVWSQEPTLEIKLRVNGRLMYLDFSDATTVYDTPKTRSPGFLWYLSFYINFIATISESDSNSYLFLLDEPGVHLHPSGQKDLTNLLENISVKNQLIYTTHSPFMINRSHPERVRVITKDENGTNVNSEAYQENWKPLRQSIGLSVGDLFFFNSSGILLEIPSKKYRIREVFKKKRS